jgi:hypothetical protein
VLFRSASGNGCSIVLGWEGWPRVSTDQGVSWTASPSSVISSNAYQPPYYYLPMVGSDIAFGNGTFLVPRSFLQNGLLTTTDGVTWASRSLFVGCSVESVAYGNGTFVVCVSGGAYPAGIYQSASAATPVLTLARQASPAAVALSASGEIGRAYRLQTSSDLKTWSDRLAYTNTASGLQLVEPIVSGSTQLFYRAVSP